MPSRLVIKEGYLRKLYEGNSIFKRPLRRWYILVLVNNLPVLEYYTTREESMMKRPINDYNLSSCQMVMRNLGDREKGRFTFVIILPSRRIILEAASSEELEAWIGRLEQVLLQFGATKQENIYGGPDCGGGDCGGGEIYTDLDVADGRPSARAQTPPPDCFKKGFQVDLASGRSCTLSSDSSSGSYTAAKKREVPLPDLPAGGKKATTLPPERKGSPTPPPPPPRVPVASSEMPDDWVNNPFVFPEVAPADEAAPPPLPPRDGSPPTLPSSVARPRPRPRANAQHTVAPATSDTYGCAWDGAGAAGDPDKNSEDVYGCAWEEEEPPVPNGLLKPEEHAAVEEMIRQLDSMSARVSKLDLYLHQSGVPQNTAVEEIEEDVYDRLELKLKDMGELDQLTELRTRRNQSAHNVFKPNPDPPPFNASCEPVHMAGFFEKKVGIRGAGEVVDHKSVKDGMLTVQRTNSSPSSASNSLFITAGPDASLSALAGAVESLKKQILNPGGVAVKIQTEDLRNRVALLEIDNRVWIAGWDPKVARLHHSLHIGDQVMGFNDRVAPIDSLKTFWKMFDALPNDESRISLRLRRLPYAKVVAIRRDSGQGQQMDIVRVRGTNEISYIKQGGLLARHGLPSLCKNFDPANCGFLEGNWFLTEVNGRTLNLFFKNNEVDVALNAYGTEISIVVQPADFVKRLKKALKVAKKYKGYVGYQ